MLLLRDDAKLLLSLICFFANANAVPPQYVQINPRLATTSSPPRILYIVVVVVASVKIITSRKSKEATMASPTSVLSSTVDKKDALDLKNDGNAHFKKRRFDEALACYSEGIAVVAHDEDDLEATLYSNISSCYFEMGDYGKR